MKNNKLKNKYWGLNNSWSVLLISVKKAGTSPIQRRRCQSLQHSWSTETPFGLLRFTQNRHLSLGRQHLTVPFVHTPWKTHTHTNTFTSIYLLNSASSFLPHSHLIILSGRMFLISWMWICSLCLGGSFLCVSEYLSLGGCVWVSPFWRPETGFSCGQISRYWETTSVRYFSGSC